jgi:uncharacterized protein (DUF1015 family)
MSIIKKFKSYINYNTGKYEIWGTQDFIDSNKITNISNDMRNDNYDFNENKIAGYLHNNIYYVTEGHHRITSALRLWKKSGDYTFVEQLIENGLWYSIKKEPYPKYKLRII